MASRKWVVSQLGRHVMELGNRRSLSCNWQQVATYIRVSVWKLDENTDWVRISARRQDFNVLGVNFERKVNLIKVHQMWKVSRDFDHRTEINLFICAEAYERANKPWMKMMEKKWKIFDLLSFQRFVAKRRTGKQLTLFSFPLVIVMNTHFAFSWNERKLLKPIQIQKKQTQAIKMEFISSFS